MSRPAKVWRVSVYTPEPLHQWFANRTEAEGAAKRLHSEHPPGTLGEIHITPESIELNRAGIVAALNQAVNR